MPHAQPKSYAICLQCDKEVKVDELHKYYVCGCENEVTIAAVLNETHDEYLIKVVAKNPDLCQIAYCFGEVKIIEPLLAEVPEFY